MKTRNVRLLSFALATLLLDLSAVVVTNETEFATAVMGSSTPIDAQGTFSVNTVDPGSFIAISTTLEPTGGPATIDGTGASFPILNLNIAATALVIQDVGSDTMTVTRNGGLGQTPLASIASPTASITISKPYHLNTGNIDLSQGGTLIVDTPTPIEMSNRFILDQTGGNISTTSGTTLTLSGLLTDGTTPGLLLQTGLLNLGTLILPNANSYTGGTTLGGGGSLRVAHSQALGTGILTLNPFIGEGLNLADGIILPNPIITSTGGIVTVDSGAAATLSGGITTTGFNGLIKKGEGTLTLTGVNSYTATTDFQTGTLILGPGVDLGSGQITTGGGGGNTTLGLPSGASLPNNITISGTLKVDVPVGSASLNGAITAGELRKLGTGTLVLNGTHNAGPFIEIVEGTLALNGTMLDMSSGVVVNSGATLKGTGTAAGFIGASSGGKVAPGQSPGTLNINGNYLPLSGSTLEIEITPTQASQLAVNGNVTIPTNVAFHIVPNPGVYTGPLAFPVVLINGGTLSGTFNPPTFESALISNPQLTYSANQILLTLSVQNFASASVSGNSSAVGGALDTIAASGSGALTGVIANLTTLNSQQLNGALTVLQPAEYKGGAILQEAALLRVQNALGSRFQMLLDGRNCEISCGPKNRSKTELWVDLFGDFLHQDSLVSKGNPQVGYNSQSVGVVAGVDFNPTKVLYLGALGAYSHAGLDWLQNQGDGHINSGYGGLYLSLIGDIYYLNTAAIGSWNGYHFERKIVYPGMNRTAHTGHGGKQLLAHADLGGNWGVSGFSLRPFDAVDYIIQEEDSFTESQAGDVSLSVKRSTASMLRNELGMNFAKCFGVDCGRWIVDLKLSWIREIRFDGAKYTSQFINTGVYFTTQGYFPTRNLLGAGALIGGMFFDNKLTVDIYYNGEFGSKFYDQSIGGQFGVNF
jgi:fibronectin-binding autotransporter adhesin